LIKHIRWQILLVLVGIGLLVSLLAYVALNFSTVWVAGSGGTYVEGLAGTPQFINPLLCQPQTVDGDLCSLIFNGLTRLDHHGEVVPDLADHWEISPDGLTYTFSLRRGVRWHDGTPFTASDVVFTAELLKDPNFSGQADWQALWQTVTVTMVDPNTVRFDLEEPYAAFLDYTTVGVLPQHLLKGVPAEQLPSHPFNLAPVGTGILRLSELVTGTERISHVILDTNPYYLGQKPLIERIQFKFYPSGTAVYQAYLDGEVQGIGRVPAENLPDAQANPRLQLFSSELPRFTLVFLNHANAAVPFLGEPKVRQALLYALDRQALIDRVLTGQAVVAHGPVLSDSWAHDPDVPVYAHDPEKAAALLEEDGWRAIDLGPSSVFSPTEGITGTTHAWFKDRLPLAFTLLVSDDPVRTAVAQEIARQWAQVGIQVAVEPLASGLVAQRLTPRDYQAALVDLDLTTSGDPDPYPFWHETEIEPPGQNYAGYKSREMSEILETARLTPDRSARKELYHEFQQLFAKDVPAILLYNPVYNYAVDQYVYGVHVGPIVRPGDRFLGLADWYVRLRRVIQSDIKAEGLDAVTP
jgi:peptide/nickel transport system substrate-binding protein